MNRSREETASQHEAVSYRRAPDKQACFFLTQPCSWKT